MDLTHLHLFPRFLGIMLVYSMTFHFSRRVLELLPNPNTKLISLSNGTIHKLIKIKAFQIQIHDSHGNLVGRLASSRLEGEVGKLVELSESSFHQCGSFSLFLFFGVFYVSYTKCLTKKMRTTKYILSNIQQSIGDVSASFSDSGHSAEYAAIPLQKQGYRPINSKHAISVYKQENMCCCGGGDDDGCRCRPLGFLLGLPFALLSLLISIVGVIIWIVGLLLSCICPCCLCVTVLVEIALELIKAPIHVMEWFISKIPC